MLDKKPEKSCSDDKQSPARYALSVVAVLGCVCVSSWISTSLGTESIDAIKQSLSEQADNLSPIELEWSVKRSCSMEENALMLFLGYKDVNRVEFFSEKSTTFRWQDRMIYLYERGTAAELSRERKGNVRKIPYGREYAFNLTYLYVGDAEKETRAAGLIPMLVIDTIDEPVEHHAEDRMFAPGYLSVVGFWTPQKFGDLGKPARHELVRLLEEGALIESASTTEFDGIKCEQVKVEWNSVQSIFTFDPGKGYALRQRKDIDKKTGLPIKTTFPSEFQQVSNRSLWIPNRIQVDYFVDSGKRPPDNAPLYIDHFVLKKVNSQVLPLDTFMLRYNQPGTAIVDYNLPEVRKTHTGYRIPADLKDVKAALEKRHRNWFLLLNVAVLCVLIIIFIWRRKREWIKA